jgi:O-antigen/teichoic acid export membrane protein
MLTTKTILGAGWTVSSRLAGRAIDFITVLVLARALTPADFGLTAIATSLVFILDVVFEVPLIVALTRLKDVKKSHLDTAFTLGLMRGLVLSFAVLATAWPFARIYSDNRLFFLVAALVVGPIARSLSSPAMVDYVRQMSFRQNFAAEFLGKVISSVLAISVAYLGGSYWAIVVGSISSSVATTLISYFIAPYRPKLSLSMFSEFSTFLGWFSLAQIFSAVSWQFDRILLGYFIPKSDLGQYTMASDVAVLPTQSMIGPAMQPLIAAFSQINDDRERLRIAYSKASRFTMMLAAPTSIGMSLTSDLIVSVLLGAKWTEAAVYLQWLALSFVLGAFYQPLSALALATNRTNLIFRLTFLEACFRIVLVLAGLYFYSLMGVIVARLAMSLIMFIASLLAAQYLIGARATSELINLWKVAAACATMALLVMMMRHELHGRGLNAVVELVLTAAVGVAVYVGTLAALGVRLEVVPKRLSDRLVKFGLNKTGG